MKMILNVKEQNIKTLINTVVRPTPQINIPVSAISRTPQGIEPHPSKPGVPHQCLLLLDVFTG